MNLKKKIATVALGAVALTGAGIALAAWTSTVDGVGAAQSKTSDSGTGDLTAVNPVAADDLYPGAVKSTFVDVENDNDYPVVVTAIPAGSSRAVGSCPVDSVRTDARTTDESGLFQSDNSTKVIAPGATGRYVLTLRMANDASNECKSKTFVIGDRTTVANPLVASVKSAASTANNF